MTTPRTSSSPDSDDEVEITIQEEPDDDETPPSLSVRLPDREEQQLVEAARRLEAAE